jgi:hypothetical protein
MRYFIIYEVSENITIEECDDKKETIHCIADLKKKFKDSELFKIIMVIRGDRIEINEEVRISLIRSTKEDEKDASVFSTSQSDINGKPESE